MSEKRDNTFGFATIPHYGSDFGSTGSDSTPRKEEYYFYKII